ncbi:hypothetical protein [Streptomyces melanogenes]|uniref:Integral membrane protein n=1 Tax=Streptomyces melanogenes TaxID=67326 RepID=A0ABZ1XIR4_9ACTN|nr:hypothetical protein [Streptomyces melanogenes]
MELQQPPPRQPEGCLTVAIRIPVRIVVLVLVVPIRMIWDALTATARAIHRTLLRPVGRALKWLGHTLVVVPLVHLGRGLAWLARTLVVVPLVFLVGCLAWLVRTLVVTPLTWLWRWLVVPLWRYGVVVPATWVYQHLLTPVGHGIAWVAVGLGAGVAWAASAVWAGLARVGRGIAWLAAGGWTGIAWLATGIGKALVRVGLILFVVPVGWFWRWVLTPVGRVLAVVVREVVDAFGHAWRIAGQVSRALGRGLKWLGWQLVGRPVRWVWRTVCAPVLYWVRDTLWAPVKRAAVEAGRVAGAALRTAGRTAREALASARETVRQARADAWRALVGGPPREPAPHPARTLGSTTTASGAVPAPEISLHKTEG